MTPQQLLMILWARRRLMLAVFSSIVLLTLVVSLVMPKKYMATATVVVDVKSPDPIAGMVLPGMMAPGYMATQVDIINSERVARRVVTVLKLDELPLIREQWQDDTNGQGDIKVWLAELLQKSLDVRPSRESNVVEINFSGVDPEFSAAVANAFAQAYIETNIELRVDPAKQYASWFDSQISVQRDRLEAAQKKLSDYQQSNGIVATDERLDYETQKFNELSAQLTMIQTQGADATSKQKVGSAETLPEVMQNPLIIQLKADVARMEAKIKEMSGNLGANHPQMQRSQAELAELKARLRDETYRISSSIATTGRVNVGKEKEVAAAIEEQRAKVLGLKQQRDEINVLMREVESAKQAFDAVSQRMVMSKLESQSIQTNISILNSATPPLEHSRPRILLNMLVSIFLGGMLAAGGAFLLELLQRRIRSVQDLAQLIELPVLAEIGSIHPPLQYSSRFAKLKAMFGRRVNQPRLSVGQ